MHGAYILTVWLHILAAVVWVGGAVFLVTVLVPTIRGLQFRDRSLALIKESGRRFKHVGWGCLVVLVVTGLGLLHFRGVSGEVVSSAGFWDGTFGQVLLFKLILVGIILGLSALHDFMVGPEAVAAWQKDPQSAETKRLRRMASWMGRLNLVLGLLVILLGVMLVRGRPW